MSRCLVVQHAPAEPANAIGTALRRRAVDVDLRRTYLGEPLPADLAGFDGIVVMGGPMSARLDEGFPTRRAEIELLVEAVKRELPTLAVCLGAQLLALAAGGEVRPGGAGLEIGWAPIGLSRAAADDPLMCWLPGALEVFHWHGDTFQLPPEAHHLASNTRYNNQAFRIGPRAWGLQFHLEVDQVAVESMLAAFADEADQVEGGASGILAVTEARLRALLPHRDHILDAFAALVDTPIQQEMPTPEVR